MMLLLFMPITWIIGMGILFLETVSYFVVKNERFLTIQKSNTYQIVLGILLAILFVIPFFK